MSIGFENHLFKKIESATPYI